MFNTKKVLDNLQNLKGQKMSHEELYNEVVAAFGEEEFKGESYVVFNSSHNSGYDYIAYIDHAESPQFLFQTVEDEEEIQITGVRLA